VKVPKAVGSGLDEADQEISSKAKNEIIESQHQRAF